MTEKIDQSDLIKKTKEAIMALSARSIILYCLQIASRVVLAKNLLAADFGTFGILQGTLGCLLVFTDFGLGDILSRKAEGFSKEDFAGYFFLRLSMGVVMSLFFIVSYPWICAHYGFQFSFQELGVFTFLFILLDVLAACPLMLLGHRMEFSKVAKIELFGMVLTYVIQILASYSITGPWPFFIGIFFGKLLSVIMALLITKDLTFPRYRKGLVKMNLKDGFFFQLTYVIPSLQAIVGPLIMAKFLKVDAIGLVFWLEGLVNIPLNLIYNYNRVAFITLSKFTHNREQLVQVTSRFFMTMSLGIGLVFGLGAVLSKSIILLVFGDKWSEATNYAYLSCISVCMYSIRYLGLSVLSANNLPHVRVVNDILIFGTNVLVQIIFISWYGIEGYFYGMILSSLVTMLAMIYSVRVFLDRLVYRRLTAVLISMLASAFFIIRSPLYEKTMVVIALVYCFSYCLLCAIIEPTVFSDLRHYLIKLKNRLPF